MCTMWVFLGFYIRVLYQIVLKTNGRKENTKIFFLNMIVYIYL